jgi:hypothetical protein
MYLKKKERRHSGWAGEWVTKSRFAPRSSDPQRVRMSLSLLVFSLPYVCVCVCVWRYIFKFGA